MQFELFAGMDYRAMKLDYFSIFNEKIIINSQQLNRSPEKKQSM